MTTIPLTQGKVAFVDDEDAESVLAFKWTYYFNRRNQKTYARRSVQRDGKSHSVYLHRFIMGEPAGSQVDHKNNDGLDCQRHNLRLATNSQNHQNMQQKRTSTYQYKCVYRNDSVRPRWHAKIQHDRKVIHLGSFDTPEAAARAYDARAKELFGEFARLNFP